MLKLPKGLKKKKKGKKSKRKGEEELFTEEELEKYRQQQRQAEAGAHAPGSGAEHTHGEQWSQFEHLASGVDCVLRRTQGDLDRIKSTSFFQRVPPAAAAAPRPPREDEVERPVVRLTEADFPQLAQAQAAAEAEPGAASESSAESEDDIFDTSYVEAAQRGEVRLACVPDSPPADDGCFDTSHVDALLRGEGTAPRSARVAHKALDIGVAVEVLTGRIDNFSLPTARRSKRAPPATAPPPAARTPPAETCILDTDADIPITSPIDLSVSLHTSLIRHNRGDAEREQPAKAGAPSEEDELDEFAQLAAESLEAGADVLRVADNDIKLEPVLQESWSAFEADRGECVFAGSIVEDQVDAVDAYLGRDDPFDTSFADAAVPAPRDPAELDDDEFDPRAEDFIAKLNNRRKSSVRIHLTDPAGVRESITSDDVPARDLLGGSATDLARLADAPLAPADVDDDVDPFDTTIVDRVAAPGKVELKLLERELIGAAPALYRVPSDPEFDPRAEEPAPARRASRPENLVVGRSVVFDVDEETTAAARPRPPLPPTPYYRRQPSICEEPDEPLHAKVLTPAAPPAPPADPFDTSFASSSATAPSRTELRLLAHEFSCEAEAAPAPDPLESADDIFQARALSPARAPAAAAERDPFDTSFASLQPGRTELRLLESELLH